MAKMTLKCGKWGPAKVEKSWAYLDKQILYGVHLVPLFRIFPARSLKTRRGRLKSPKK